MVEVGLALARRRLATPLRPLAPGIRARCQWDGTSGLRRTGSVRAQVVHLNSCAGSRLMDGQTLTGPGLGGRWPGRVGDVLNRETKTKCKLTN